MITKLRLSLLLHVVLSLTALSCQRYADRDRIVNEKDTYFSIKQFAADQIKLHSGQPYSLNKVTYLDGNIDTTVVNFMNLDWTPIFKTFGETDIANKKFIGKYAFSSYEDDATTTHSFTYTAKDAQQFTRLLQISADPDNGRIKSIYIETAKQDFFGSTKQKLLYVPMQIIQIQESQSSKLGKSRKLRVDYRFMGEDYVDAF